MLRASLRLWVVLCFALLALACADTGDDISDGDLPDGDLPEDGDTPDGDTPDGDTPDGDTPDGDTPIVGDPFRFAVISDTHVRLEGKPDAPSYDPTLNQDNLLQAVQRINAEYADSAFVALTGDMVGCLYSENLADYGVGEENPAEVFVELTAALTMPMYTVLGNHDYQNNYDAQLDEGVTTDDIEAIEAVWKKVLDLDPYYSVVHEGVRMIFLNANRGPQWTVPCMGCENEAMCTGSFDDEQLDWFENEMEQGDPVIIFMHHPPITDNSSSLFAFISSFLVVEDDPFYDITAAYKDQIMAIFVGHGHIWEHDTLFENIDVYETGSLGDTNGNGDNIHIVDVDPNGPSIEVTIVREGATYWSEM